MTDQITSSELRGFVADNTGRRKIDTEASMELHVRAATYLDALNQHISDLQHRLHEAQAALAQAEAAAPAAAAPAQDPADGAMMLLRNAQTAADETLAEAARIRAEATTTLENAESHARREAESHLAAAREEAHVIIADAEQQAIDIASANEKAVDRAHFIQRQYVEKASSVRQEAEALVEFSRQVENLAETEMNLPLETPAPPAEASAPPPPPPADVVAEHARTAELSAVHDASVTEAAEAVVAEATEMLEDAADEPAPFDQETAAPSSQFLPPPPPPAAAAVDVLDLTESELEEALDSGDTIDDELFGDDELEGEVIDLRDNGEKVTQDFQFFGREA